MTEGIQLTGGAALAALWGALWGSFLNVCIFRIPAARSIVWPGSRCGACGHDIAWYDNIPILSWLVLRARCRHCKTSLDAQYPLVELLTALLSMALYRRFGFGAEYAAYFVFLCFLVVMTWIDLKYSYLFDVLTLPLMALGLAWSFVPGGTDPLSSAIGIAAGYGFFWALALFWTKVLGRDGMGDGDFKLLGGIGAFLGWQALPLVLLLSSVQGVAAAIVLRVSGHGWEPAPPPLYILKKHGITQEELDAELAAERAAAEAEGAPAPSFARTALPFGPFLALGAIEALFFGDWFSAWQWALAERLAGG